MRTPSSRHSLLINGRKTSISLEAAFWKEFKKIAHTQRLTVTELLSRIDKTREYSNLSATVRLFVLDHIRNEYERTKAS